MIWNWHDAREQPEWFQPRLESVAGTGGPAGQAAAVGWHRRDRRAVAEAHSAPRCRTAGAPLIRATTTVVHGPARAGQSLLQRAGRDAARGAARHPRAEAKP